jgi:hypothetical protein
MTLRAPRPHQIEYSDDAQAKQEQIEQKRGTKALPFAIAVGLGLLAVAFVLRACQWWPDINGLSPHYDTDADGDCRTSAGNRCRYCDPYSNT